MFAFVIALVVQIWMAIISKALTRPPRISAGVVETPRSEEASSIPAAFGTVRLAPNIVWWGDVTPVPIKSGRRVFGLAGPRDTIGYRYYVGMQGALCWGAVDELVDIIVADTKSLSTAGPSSSRVVAGSGYTTTTSDATTPDLPVARVDAGQLLAIAAADLFGGKEMEGGVLGDLRFYFGSATQNANAYLATNVEDPFPAYRGLCYAVWEHVYLGTTPYLKAWHFVVRRCPTTLGTLAGDTALSRIGDAANPAEILYEIWTDARWGLGESSSALDTASFLSALQTLSDEGLGISGTISEGSADEMAKEILRTIDGVLVEDPQTGKLTLTLIRADYDVDALEVYTRSNSSQLTVSRGDWDTLSTEVKVSFTDASRGFTTRTRAAYNPAVRAAIGRARGAAFDYPLVPTGETAEALALRDLHAVSTPLAAGSITLPRTGAALKKGDPFVIDWPDDGLPSTVVRGTRFRYGSIHGREVVEVDFVQDVFGVAGGVYATEPSDDWTAPTPTDAGRRFEVDTEFVLSDTQGCLTLEITGDVSSITLVETRTQQGGEVAGAWVEEDNSAPITVCVDRDDRETGHIAYRITYTDGDGEDQTLEGNEAVPPLGADDGNADGTPGNLGPWTLQATPPVIVRSVGADVYEPVAFKPFRKYFNTNKVGGARIQLGNHRASGDDVEAPLLYSLDGGATFAEAGPTVRLDRVNYPEPGAFTALVAGAIGPNVMLNVGLKGGDGTTVVKVGNIYVESTSSATPPDSPTGDTPDVPTGGALGSLLIDLDARTYVGVVDDLDGVGNGDSGMGPTTMWIDQTGNGHDGSYNEYSIAPSAPQFRTNGLGTGYPSVWCHAGYGNAMVFPSPHGTSLDFTYYIVAGNIEGAGSDGRCWANAALLTNHAGSSVADMAITVRTDGRVVYGVGENAAVATTASRTSLSSWDGDGTKHVFAFRRTSAGGHFRLFVDGADDSPEGENSTGALLDALPYCVIGAFGGGLNLEVHYGRIIAYDKAHTADQIALVTAALRAQWGTP